MNDFLRISFVTDNDGTGELFAEVYCGGFSGKSHACFSEEQTIAFAQKLAAAYPLPRDAPLKLEGGYWGETGTGIVQVLVGIEFYPIGYLGHIGCRVSLNKPNHEFGRPIIQSSVVVELKTTYPRVEVFAKSLEMLVKRQTDEALLEAQG